jgi:hypothetical protein
MRNRAASRMHDRIRLAIVLIQWSETKQEEESGAAIIKLLFQFDK